MYKRYQVLDPDKANEYYNTLRVLDWRTRTERGMDDQCGKMRTMMPDDYPAVAPPIMREILAAMSANANFILDTLAIKFDAPWFHYSTPGAGLPRHSDAIVNIAHRSDFSMSVFLTAPDTYEGGELVLESPVGPSHSIKGNLGEVIVYPTGWPHQVNKVTDGERMVMAVWAQSQCRDILHRERLAKLRLLIYDMTEERKAHIDASPELAEKMQRWIVDAHSVNSYLRLQWLDTPTTQQHQHHERGQ